MQIAKNTPTELVITAAMRQQRILMICIAIVLITCCALRAKGVNFGVPFLVRGPDANDLPLIWLAAVLLFIGISSPDFVSIRFDAVTANVVVRKQCWPFRTKESRTSFGEIARGEVFEDEGTLRFMTGHGWFGSSVLASLSGAEKAVPVINAWLKQTRSQ
jgi:hypothetical protein